MLTKEEIIALRKEYSRIVNISKQQAKRGECLWCGKKITRFCNSHSVPQCVLKNIDLDGKLDYFNSMLHLPLIKEDKGLGEAGTFRLICSDCDNTIFQDYEELCKLESEPTEIMLEEIALKNVLMMLDKRYFEIELYHTLEKEYNVPYPYAVKQETNTLDERDFWLDFLRIKEMRSSLGNNKKAYKMFFWKKLDYVIPIAFQGLVTLYGDLEGDLVTDMYNTSEDVIVKHMHLCMFPLESSSVVFAFYHEDDVEYDNFAEQFGKLEEDEKLAVLSYIVYGYCEDMLFAKKFPHRTWVINKVRDTFMKTTEIWALDKEHAEYQKKLKMKQLKDRDKDFPCILSKKFAVKKSI